MISLYREAQYDIKKTEPYVRKMFKNIHELVLADEQIEDPYKVVRRYNPLLSGISLNPKIFTNYLIGIIFLVHILLVNNHVDL